MTQMVSSQGTQETLSLGSTKLRQPLGIGTLQWGTTWVDGKMVRGGRTPDDTVQDVVRECLAAGVTFFDTAEGYGGGTSEARLGRALAGSKGTSVVATKFLPTLWRCRRAALLRAARRSLLNLGAAQLDLYFIHTPIHWLPVEWWIEAACDAKDAGLIKELGVSNFNADQVRRAHAVATRRGYSIAANQIMFGLLNYGNARLLETLRVCKELNIAVVAFSPIGQGLLTASDANLEGNRVARMAKVDPEALQKLRSTVAIMAKELDKSPVQVALNWVICHGFIPLIGCRSVRQAKDTLGCLGWRLSEEQVGRLDSVACDYSTLDGKMWKRVFFSSLFGCVMVVCRALSWVWGSSWP